MNAIRGLLVRTVLTATLVTAGVAGSAGVADAAPNHWGAIAVSPRTGNVGLSWDDATRAGAARRAVHECGRSDCQAVVMVANGCAALAQAPNRALGWAYAGSLRAAENAAVHATRGRGARVIDYVCTTGHA